MNDGGSRLPGWLASLHRGQQFAALVVVAYVLFLGASAATAPPISMTGAAIDAGGASSANATAGNATGVLEGTGSRATLVGRQGPFRDAQGRALLVRANGSIAWRSPETWAHLDVSPIEGGRVLAAFIERGVERCGEYEPPCARTGFRIYDPGAANPIVREWTYPVRHHMNSEVHDVEMLPTGNVLVVGMEYERIFAVDPAGEITWEWRASSFYDAPADPTTTDWLHLNDVDRIGPGRYLVSVRNENQLAIVERGEGVVEVINEDGDPAVLDEQHNPQWLGEGRVLVSDSHNDRIVELRKRDGSWEVAWKLGSAGGIPFHWPRDADLLANGNVLVTDTFNNRVVEVTRNGTLVWSVSPGKIPYEADRLPGGEYSRALLEELNATIPLSNHSGAGVTNRVRLPGITLLFSAINSVFVLPYWVNQWHLLGGIVALISSIGGLAWSRRAE